MLRAKILRIKKNEGLNKSNCCLRNVAAAAGGHTSINMTSPWLFQPVGQVMMWLEQAVAQMHAHICMMFFHIHRKPHVFTIGCYSRRRLLQPAAGGGSIQLFEHGPGVVPKGPEQPPTRLPESIGQEHEVGYILGENHVGLVVLALAFR